MNDDVLPIFVKIEEYKDVVDIVTLLKEKVRSSRQNLADLHKLKQEEDELIEKWGSSVDDVEAKLLFIERTLFEPKGL